jgi:hypothetical protein
MIRNISPRKAMFVALLGFLATGTVSAQSIVASETNAFINQQDHGSSVVFTNTAPATIGAFDFVLTYNPANLTIESADITTSSSGTACAVNPAGTILCFANPEGIQTVLPAVVTINLPFDIGGIEAVEPLTFGVTNVFDEDVNPVALVPDNGQITISAAPPVPPTVTFAPNGGPINLTAPGGALQGSLSNESVIAITAVGGSGAGVGSYNCVVDPGAPFDISNLADANVAVGDDPADMSVICTLGAVAVAANMNCTRTGGDATPVNFALTCPAGVPVPSPAYSSNPAPGATLNCDGDAGTLTQTSVTITNTGLAGVNSELDYSCSTASAGFSVISGAAGSIIVDDSATVTVQCKVPAEGDPAATGTLDCTHNATNENSPVRYGLSSIADTAPPAVPQPNVVPASSLWSQLSLIGLLAALGLLVVGIRRNH